MVQTSVVLCTFNGEKYLPAQLESLAQQTSPPSEIIVQDDGSEDGTLAILQSHGSVVLHRNPSRLGFAANFASALTKAQGEFIFLCDQDDIWQKEKIEKFLAHFHQHPEQSLVFSDASLIDETGKSLAYSILHLNRLGESDRLHFPRFVQRNPIPGMAMAFRRSLLAHALPIPPEWEHDYWLLLIAAAEGKIGFLKEPLVRYRQHAAQAIGGARSLQARAAAAASRTLAKYQNESRKFTLLRERLSTFLPVDHPYLQLVAAKEAFLLSRAQYPRFRLWRMGKILSNAASYHQFEAGWSSAIKDLIIPA